MQPRLPAGADLSQGDAMKSLVLSLFAASLLLCGCSTPQRAFENDPGQYGLYVATTNIFANSTIVVRHEDTGKFYAIKVNHIAAGDSAGYAMASLPAGRYTLQTYSPDGRSNYPITTANGWFQVQNDCFNYGGHFDFALGDDGMPSYANTNTLQDIQDLPHHYRDLAEGRDICSATMGHDGERLKAEDVAKVMDL
jgi:hypothetical protein